MKLLSLQNNALFLKNWRERMRPPTILASATVMMLIIVLIIVGNYLGHETRESMGHLYDKHSPPVSWLRLAFFQIAMLQGFILLLLGSHAANKMARQERISGTLDFHRCSPTSRIDQIIGIVFGAPILEWCLFLGSLLLSFLLALFSGMNSVVFCAFYVAFILCAVFYHSLAIIVGICSNQKKQQAGIIPLLLLSWLIMPFFFALQLSTLYYMTFIPMYSFLTKHTVDLYASLYPHQITWEWNVNSLFACPLRFPLLQFLVQLPLIVFIWAMLKRKISYIEKSILSKSQLVVFIMLLLFYFIGSASTLIVSENQYAFPHEALMGLFLYIIVGVLFIGSIIATPTQLMYQKGLNRAKKLGLRRLSLSDDQNSNWLWLIVACFAVTGMYYIFLRFTETAFLKRILFLVVLLSQCASFAGALEWFRLSKHHEKMVVFWVSLSILWIFIPLFGLITKTMSSSPYYLQYFFSPSPLFSIPLFCQSLFEPSKDILIHISVFLLVNLSLAATATYAAFRERLHLRNTILQ